MILHKFMIKCKFHTIHLKVNNFNSMKTRNILFILLALTISVGCERTDFDEILRRHADHEMRIVALETLVATANSEITTIKGLINALEGKVSINSYTELSDKSGYELLMSDGSKIVLKNGDKGESGSVPSVNVKQHIDGLLYWTLNGEFMLDGNGKMILAQGVKGDKGEDGANGQTPQMRVNSSNDWEVSVDNGTNWQTVKDSNGNPVKATGEVGPQGPQGPAGSGGDIDLTITESESTIVIEYNGVVYTVVKGESSIDPSLPYITFKTTKEIGEELIIDIDVANYADRDECWIDLNNNKVRDPGEEIQTFGTWVSTSARYIVGSSLITIYGKVTKFTSGYYNDFDTDEITGNDIIEFDLSNNKELEYLHVSYNDELTNVDISQNKKLEVVDLSISRKLQQIDTSQNEELVRLTLYSCYEIKSVDVSNNRKLQDLDLAYTWVDELDISNNNELNYIRWDYNIQKTDGYKAGTITKLVSDLPDRTSKDKGRLILYEGAPNNITTSEIQTVLDKNWDFEFF